MCLVTEQSSYDAEVAEAAWSRRARGRDDGEVTLRGVTGDAESRHGPPGQGWGGGSGEEAGRGRGGGRGVAQTLVSAF